jgi:dienelactone hydrolase
LSLDRKRLRALLGLRAGGAVRTSVKRGAASPLGHGITRGEVTLDRGEGPIPGTLLRPDGEGPHPAILYCHAHGNAWGIGRRELLEGRPALKCGPYGPVLAQAGFAVLCLDMPGHGDRQAEGTEGALAKAALWRGGTLMGRMLGDLMAGLDALQAEPWIDGARIGAMGLSMGATHAYWLAALDDRVTAVAHLCAFADMGPLIASGAHDLHGVYMTVPGFLDHGDMGDVAALIAPRPQFIAFGGRDPLTPGDALRPALDRVRGAYRDAGASGALILHGEAQAGHEETAGMRAAVLSFLTGAFGPPGRGADATEAQERSPDA